MVAPLAQSVAVVRETEPRLRWVHPSRWHVTLCFLGDVAPAQVVAMQPALAALAAQPALDLTIVGTGRFPGVLWVGVSGPGLKELAAGCAAAARRAGVPLEGRPWIGHLTLARGRVRRLPRGLAVTPLRWRAERVSLLRSPAYDELAGWRLG